MEDQPAPDRLAHKDTMSEDGEVRAEMREVYNFLRETWPQFTLLNCLRDQLAARRRAEFMAVHSCFENNPACKSHDWQWPDWQKAADEELK